MKGGTSAPSLPVFQALPLPPRHASGKSRSAPIRTNQASRRCANAPRRAASSQYFAWPHSVRIQRATAGGIVGGTEDVMTPQILRSASALSLKSLSSSCRYVTLRSLMLATSDMPTFSCRGWPPLSFICCWLSLMSTG